MNNQFQFTGTVKAQTEASVPNCYYVEAKPDMQQSVLKWLMEHDKKNVRVTFDLLDGPTSNAGQSKSSPIPQ